MYPKAVRKRFAKKIIIVSYVKRFVGDIKNIKGKIKNNMCK
jgi:hypothetical protein